MNSHLKCILVVVGVHAFLLATVSSKSVPGIEKISATLVNGSSPEANLRLIGTVDGKSYYIEDTVPRTWSQAQFACIIADLDGLGRIETEREWDFLQSRSEVTNSVSWTAGREYLTMMGWNNKKAINPAIIKNFNGGNGNDAGGRCMSIYVHLGVVILPCDIGIGTLCEKRT